MDAGPPPPLKRVYFPVRLNLISLVVVLSLLGARIYFGGRIARLRDRRYAEFVAAARKNIPIARRDQLTGSGRIYLVQMGPHTTRYALEGFARWLHGKYGLDVRVLPAVSLDATAWDPQRRQYVGELLTEQLQRNYPALASDPQAYLIGFTDADMYLANANWNFSFTWRAMPRAAVISANRMRDSLWERLGSGATLANEHYQARLRRILLKDVAILYWHLPLNNDPLSLLHATLNPDLPIEDIYESDLDPERTQWGRHETAPCVYFSYSAAEGMKPLPGTLIRGCGEVPEEIARDESVELFEVNLRTGVLLDLHTDFYLPDSIPIQFERATRDGWKGPAAFGISGSHNYDSYLYTEDGMRSLVVYHPEGYSQDLRRVPAWLAMLSFVKYVDADDSGRKYELHWRGRKERFEMKDYEGNMTTYLPCAVRTPPCYESGYRNAKGEQLLIERDSQRRLTRVESPHHRWIHLGYGAGDRIAEIDDSSGRRVEYLYDEGGRMVRVVYPSGEVLSYRYDGKQRLLRVSAAPDAKSNPVVMLRNDYQQGRIARQTLASGGRYTYDYTCGADGTIRAATVRTPKGTVYDLNVGKRSVVRESGPLAAR